MEILKAENIYKSFGENKVLKGASLTLNKGEIVSLLGVSGGGKTTLFNVLSGISKPESCPTAGYCSTATILRVSPEVSAICYKRIYFCLTER